MLDDLNVDRLKALTMLDMVEDVKGHTPGSASRKLLYLTNEQASVLASGGDALMDAVISELELGNPKLVINLFTSFDPTTSTSAQTAEEDRWDKVSKWADDIGQVFKKGPWESQEKQRRARGRLDALMREVIIPLAAE